MTLLADFLPAVTWWHVAVAVTVYYVSRTIYRLTLHPLAKFPGPKLAAITRLYEGYYDVIQEGQYTFKIGELHKQYGPIIRISPHELHINDPSYFEKLYRQDGRWDKYDWAYIAQGRGLDTAFTAPDHYLHKTIRQPLSPFFSKANVGRKLDLVRKHLDKLDGIISRKAASKEVFDLGAAISAWARDVSNEFILGKSYDNLDKDDFDHDFTTLVSDNGRLWRYNKHLPFLRIAFSLPWDFMIMVGDKGVKNVFSHLKVTLHDTKQIIDAHLAKTSSSASKPTSTDHTHTPTRTIINDILDSSSLPSHLKSTSRIHQDIVVMTGAGFETTASTLRLIIYHLFSTPPILSRLRSELTESFPGNINLSDPASYSAWYRELEQLPYLTAILMEGLRLSPALASRMQRVAPDRELVYHPQPNDGNSRGEVKKEWVIPRGTPVGMTQILMHWDESVYGEDAREFRPERWMDEEFRKRVAGGERMWAPFSRGTRNCLGMHLAWAELYLCIATLAQHFDLEFPGHSVEDFEASIDAFVILTKSRGELRTVAKVRG